MMSKRTWVAGVCLLACTPLGGCIQDSPGSAESPRVTPGRADETGTELVWWGELRQPGNRGNRSTIVGQGDATGFVVAYRRGCGEHFQGLYLDGLPATVKPGVVIRDGVDPAGNSAWASFTYDFAGVETFERAGTSFSEFPYDDHCVFVLYARLPAERPKPWWPAGTIFQASAERVGTDVLRIEHVAEAVAIEYDSGCEEPFQSLSADGQLLERVDGAVDGHASQAWIYHLDGPEWIDEISFVIAPAQGDSFCIYSVYVR